MQNSRTDSATMGPFAVALNFGTFMAGWKTNYFFSDCLSRAVCFIKLVSICFPPEYFSPARELWGAFRIFQWPCVAIFDLAIFSRNTEPRLYYTNICKWHNFTICQISKILKFVRYSCLFELSIAINILEAWHANMPHQADLLK